MKLVVGLGNPGPRYAQTRHNAGFWVVDAFARSCGIGARSDRYGGFFATAQCAGRSVALLWPQTFMNRSGPCVAAAAQDLRLEDLSKDLVVVLDDLDLPLGRLRLRKEGGDGGQRGLLSVIDALGTTAFCRLRFGVGRPPEGQEAVDYVLSEWSPDEVAPAHRAVARAAEALEAVVCEGQDVAMSRFNRVEPEVETESDLERPALSDRAGSRREME